MRAFTTLTLAAVLGLGVGSAGPGVETALAAGEKPLFPTWGWKTNFKKHSVSYEEIFSGGPPKDGIPAADKPKFVSQESADKWVKFYPIF